MIIQGGTLRQFHDWRCLLKNLPATVEDKVVVRRDKRKDQQTCRRKPAGVEKGKSILWLSRFRDFSETFNRPISNPRPPRPLEPAHILRRNSPGRGTLIREHDRHIISCDGVVTQLITHVHLNQTLPGNGTSQQATIRADKQIILPSNAAWADVSNPTRQEPMRRSADGTLDFARLPTTEAPGVRAEVRAREIRDRNESVCVIRVNPGAADARPHQAICWIQRAAGLSTLA